MPSDEERRFIREKLAARFAGVRASPRPLPPPVQKALSEAAQIRLEMARLDPKRKPPAQSLTLDWLLREVQQAVESPLPVARPVSRPPPRRIVVAPRRRWPEPGGGVLQITQEQIDALWERHYHRKATDPSYAESLVTKDASRPVAAKRRVKRLEEEFVWTGKRMAHASEESEPDPPGYMPELWEGASVDLDVLMPILVRRRELIKDKRVRKRLEAVRDAPPSLPPPVDKTELKETIMDEPKAGPRVLEYAEVARRRESGQTIGQIAEELGVGQTSVYSCMTGKKDINLRAKREPKKSGPRTPAARKAVGDATRARADAKLHTVKGGNSLNAGQKRALNRRVQEFNERMSAGEVAVARPEIPVPTSSNAVQLIRTALSLIELALKEIDR